MLRALQVSLTLSGRPLLRNVSFDVSPGETLTLMGASGSGKSTLFAWMAGALPDAFSAEGELWLNGERRDTLPTHARHIGILFQDALLFDHFSVGQNLLLALPAAIRGRARRAAVDAALENAGLGGFYPRDPATLSGGQRARVALLRAMLAQPQALLMDEPFSRLDAGLRDSFRQWVFAELKRLSIPVVLVTHDAADIPPGGRCLQLESWC
ncbi:ATP-binding cassette domain-containing protein [[Enterobacter] lignolyticus]|uniref:Sulfate ABC transporter ATP-binding protein n=1 Tax=[Enterobacter] lignolyticus TaxID=1334193 RepID=A0A806X465_9ENTR|nr:ATP-binding cassette domain-containing protein [[Enterobacter] lignolyticus]ALR76476.1 sulfate ABC transporter ATP-binding protein [[Enterobacter] lignolyticus]